MTRVLRGFSLAIDRQQAWPSHYAIKTVPETVASRAKDSGIGGHHPPGHQIKIKKPTAGAIGKY